MQNHAASTVESSDEGDEMSRLGRFALGLRGSVGRIGDHDSAQDEIQGDGDPEMGHQSYKHVRSWIKLLKMPHECSPKLNARYNSNDICLCWAQASTLSN